MQASGDSQPGRRSTHACPFCGGPGEAAVEAWDRNREVSDERFLYEGCGQCGSVFLANVPADLSRFYSGGYYGFDASGEPPWRHDPFLRKVEAYRVAALCRHVEPGSLIEIGAGAGGFAAASKDAGFEVTAVEMDSRCCDYLSERVGVDVIHSDRPLQALRSSTQVRVVAMWHVLEHLLNPQEVLQAAAERLQPGGLLAIGVPNPRSLQFRLLRARWAHLDAPRHLCLTPAPALIERGRELGLSAVDVTTSDPFGHHCNVHGWTYALKRRPGRGPAPAYSRPGVAITRLMQPLEGHGDNGSALLILLRKSGAGHVPEHG